MFDIIIENSLIVDGSGKPSYKADIGIEGSVIKAIGGLRDSHAAKRIDAAGKTVCPGFIDCHSHVDLALFRDDYEDILSPLVRQNAQETGPDGRQKLNRSDAILINRPLKRYLQRDA